MTIRGHALELLGHRGARGLAPENTLAGFARALAIGVSGFELDCAVTRDDIVVIYHDPVLNPDVTREPGGRWLNAAGPAIRDLTYEALQAYDVGRIRPGSEYERRFPAQQPADAARIPRLVDLFSLARRAGCDRLGFHLELKTSPLRPQQTLAPDAFARRVIAAIRECRMNAHCSILSFDWRALKAAQQDAPDIPTACLTAQQPWLDNVLAASGESPWMPGLHVSRFGGSVPRMIRAAGGAAWYSYYEEVTRESIDEAQALGLKVVVWTVNEPADMRRMIEWGVDGIISDRPDLLRRIASEMGITLPLATPVRP